MKKYLVFVTILFCSKLIAKEIHAVSHLDSEVITDTITHDSTNLKKLNSANIFHIKRFLPKTNFRIGIGSSIKLRDSSIGIKLKTYKQNGSLSVTGAFSSNVDAYANADYSNAFGTSTADGEFSTAIGGKSNSNGIASFAAGQETYAEGDYSVSMGVGVKTYSYGSASFGTYNIGITGSATDWSGADPLFEIGNGTGNDDRSNAVTILKNGRTDISGQLHAKSNLFVYNTLYPPTVTLKNDGGETSNPANGGLIMGSAWGGAMRLGNHYTNRGYTNTYLQLGMVDNDYAFTPVLSIPSETKYVGIGTENPGTALTIVSSNNRDQFRLGQGTINFYKMGRDDTDGLLCFQGTQSGYSGYNFRDELGTSQLYIKPNGNILIGKTVQSNPLYKLDVEGNIRANKLTVNTTGADFVFDTTYELPTLEAVEKFVKKEKHLPNISTAAEMLANGLDVGDNQIKLLQKIEELTLYMIEMNKTLNNQKAIIQDQQAELNSLKEKFKEKTTTQSVVKSNN